MDETIEDAKKVSSDPMRVAKVTLCKSTNDEYLIIPEYVLKSLNEITKKIKVKSKPSEIGHKLIRKKWPPYVISMAIIPENSTIMQSIANTTQ